MLYLNFQGRFTIAAKHLMSIAEIYEVNDIEKVNLFFTIHVYIILNLKECFV